MFVTSDNLSNNQLFFINDKTHLLVPTLELCEYILLCPYLLIRMSKTYYIRSFSESLFKPQTKKNISLRSLANNMVVIIVHSDFFP